MGWGAGETGSGPGGRSGEGRGPPQGVCGAVPAPRRVSSAFRAWLLASLPSARGSVYIGLRAWFILFWRPSSGGIHLPAPTWLVSRPAPSFGSPAAATMALPAGPAALPHTLLLLPALLSSGTPLCGHFRAAPPLPSLPAPRFGAAFRPSAPALGFPTHVPTVQPLPVGDLPAAAPRSLGLLVVTEQCQPDPERSVVFQVGGSWSHKSMARPGLSGHFGRMNATPSPAEWRGCPAPPDWPGTWMDSCRRPAPHGCCVWAGRPSRGAPAPSLSLRSGPSMSSTAPCRTRAVARPPTPRSSSMCNVSPRGGQGRGPLPGDPGTPIADGLTGH